MSQAIPLRIPLLSGGISRQPAHLRFPSQVEASSNARYSEKDGMRKRPGTTFIKKITGLTPGGNYRLQSIVRDATEKYIVVYGAGTLRVFTLDGDEATVNFTADATTYFGNGSPTADQLRLVTMADHTDIINITVTVQASNESTNYTVTASYKNYDVMTSYVQTPLAYYRADNATSVYPAGYYQYNIPDANNNGWGKWEKNNPTDWKQAYQQWDAAGTNPMGFKVRFQRQDLNITGATYTSATGVINKVGGFASYTFEAGDMVQITNAGAGITTGWYAVTSKTDNDNIVIGLGFGDAASIAVDGVSKLYDITGINFNTSPAADMYDVALRFQNALRGLGAADACVNYTATTANNGKMGLVCPYRGTGTQIVETLAPSAGYDLTLNSNRPFHFASGTNTAGSGSPATATLAIESRWDPVAAPGAVSAVINPIKMPIQMVRTTISPLVFDVSLQTWPSRTSGDQNSNPAPDFFLEAERIRDMIYARNRRWLGGGRHVLSSQSDDFNNFWKEDVANPKDSDPIIRELPGDSIALVEYFAPFRNSFAVISQAGQLFEMNSPDLLTPDSAAISATGQFQIVAVRPRVNQGQMYFLSKDDCNASLQEYYYDDALVLSRSIDVSRHVEGLLPLDGRSIAIHPDTRTVVVLGTDDASLFVFEQAYRNQERVQASWTQYDFDPSYRLCDITIIDDDYITLVESGSQFILESLPVDCRDESCDCDTTSTTTPTTTPTTTTTPMTTTTSPSTTTPSTSTTSSSSSTSTTRTPPGDTGGGIIDPTVTTTRTPIIP